MGATVLMVVILAIVLGLVLFLLAELYCSLLLGRRRSSRKKATTATNNAVENSPQQPNAPSLLTFYSQGVLQAPRNFLFPTVSDTNKLVDLEKQFPQSSTPQFDPWPVEQLYLPSASTSSRHDGEQLMYICNPIYDNEAIRLVSNIADNTPFETPDTSPSRLETIGSSSTGGTNSAVSSPSSAAVVITPPLTPMKRLLVPAEASSICLRDARSLCTTGSDSISNYNEGILSSSSGSPCTTSPSCIQCSMPML
ncbi:hypothetical protein ACJIZ3_024460 [Penstemon smallii]|uniref:Uncharacterized protein n=1 Tax=Penstemon smallii TaxID=265156 RepID=A0ABD3TRW2_9LAMI